MERSLKISLQEPTSPLWIETIQSNFDSFLQDHAACERKASATGMNFVVQYPDRSELIEPMIHLAREELLHFQQVCSLLKSRGISLASDEKNPYVNLMLSNIRHGRDARFLDRLLVFGIAEARGAERFQLLANHLTEPDLKKFYQKLAEAEARHHEIFIDIALKYFEINIVRDRLEELLKIESKIVSDLPIRAALH